MALKTRQPTKRTAWPRILLEGTEKSGKSWTVAEFSGSAKVGRTVVLVLGEDVSKWDEYGLIAGARFEIAEHDGTWPSIMAAVEGAKEEAQKAVDAGDPPFVFAFDNVTAEWEGLKDWASRRARNSQKSRKILEQDPDAEIDVSSNYWNDSKRRHRALMTVLLTFPGIVVLIARGGEVALFQNGQPVANKKTWSVEAEKSLLSDVTAHIRLSKEARPLLVSAFGVHCQAKPGANPAPRPLPEDWSLESVVFGTLKLDTANVAVSGFAEMKPDAMTPEEIRDEALRRTTTAARIAELWKEARAARYDGMTLPNEHGTEEFLLDTLARAGREKREAEWVSGWRQRLADAATGEEVAALREEASKALGAKVIQAATSSKLYAEARQRHAEVSSLADGDPWLIKIRDAATVADAAQAEEELMEAFKDTPLADPRLKVLCDALAGRKAELIEAESNAAAA